MQAHAGSSHIVDHVLTSRTVNTAVSFPFSTKRPLTLTSSPPHRQREIVCTIMAEIKRQTVTFAT